MKLFVSGPMSGLPGYNLSAFADASRELERAGYVAVNPGRRGVLDGCEWHDYMRHAIRDLLECDGVAQLHGWGESRGARMEASIAADLGMSVHLLDWWIVNRSVVA